jgi:hypothetical protein
MPWGERAEADTATVLGLTFYNPYTTPEHSSPRLKAWQFARATAEVYGRPLTQAEYDSMSEYPPRLDSSPRARFLGAIALLSFGLLIALGSELAYSRWPRPGTMAAHAVALIGAVPVLVLGAGQFFLRVRGSDATGPLLRIALRTMAAELPDNPVLALVIAGIPLAALYALLELQFRRSESAMVPTLPTRAP